MTGPLMDRPLPDRAHEALRKAFRAADQRILEQTVQMSDLVMITMALSDLAGTLGAAIPAADATHSAMDTRIDAAQINAKTALANTDALQQRMGAAELAVSSERQRAAAAESALNDAVSAEVSRAKVAEKVNADAIAALTARVDKLEALRLRGTTGIGQVTSVLASATATVTVTYRTPMPTVGYLAFPILDATSGINLSSVTATVTEKKTAGCTVQVRNSGLGVLQTVNFSVLAIDLS